ncbi:MAG: GntR family transcriptional regulator [Fibrobacteraceae bacterium]|mgnify:CR=1 FL=1|nr:GntR family transcriptional regulator [Fibrobacteraceae bacterium]MCF0221634.1 GntR family transcriptional regulator [Fibrobacter sp.]
MILQVVQNISYFYKVKKRIISALLDSDHKEGDRLPSVRTIISTYKASSGTVQAVLKELATQNKIYRIQGKGCFWGCEPLVKKVPEARQTITEKLEFNFNDDFERGFLKPNQPLPQGKELAIRYNVSQNTLRKFLTRKMDEGLLTKNGRNYFFSRKEVSERKPPISELIFVTRCNSWGGFTAESEREMDFLRLVYKTAGANQYKLILLGINESTGQLIDRNGNICKLSDYPNAIGAILSTLLVQNVQPMLYFFSSVCYPVAVWWEQPENNVPKVFLKKENWIFFNSTFGKKPGVEMGKFLMKHGMNEVNYFSPYHNSSWSQDRLTGLVEAGLKVHAYVDNEFASPWDYKEIARKEVEKYFVESYARTLVKQKIETLVKKAESDDNHFMNVCVNDEVAELIIEMKENSNKVPKLIAFDNSMESYLLRLPSFDFNTEALVEHIFYYIENPAGFGHTKKVQHILGNVVEK